MTAPQTCTVTVPAISCGHCTRTITGELETLPGVLAVTADPATKQVTVTWEPPADWAGITARLQEIGFPPARP